MRQLWLSGLALIETAKRASLVLWGEEVLFFFFFCIMVECSCHKASREDLYSVAVHKALIPPFTHLFAYYLME
jgi:hypothetical protein